MNTIQSQIEEIERKLAELKRQQSICNHVWTKPIREYKLTKEEYCTGEYERHESDSWAKTAYRDITIPIWKRRCIHCGLTQETEKTITKPVAVFIEPVF
jgi:hypothetical protein